MYNKNKKISTAFFAFRVGNFTVKGKLQTTNKNFIFFQKIY